jgi:ParB family chromosome partitioning protein
MSEAINRDDLSFVAVDPFRCRVWELNCLEKEYVNQASYRAETEITTDDGRLSPVIGRRLTGNPEFDVEVICGIRRMYIARHLKSPLLVEIRDLTDRQAALAVETEHSLRKHISPYKKGLWLATLLRQHVYCSQDEMARELRIAPAQASRLLKFADLPSMIVSAFASPHDILESWAVELDKAWSGDRRRLLSQRAHSLAKRNPRPSAVSVYEMLLASRGASARSTRRGAARVVKGPSGEPLVRFERRRKEVVLRIPNGLIDASVEKTVTEAVIAILSHRITDENTAIGSQG